MTQLKFSILQLGTPDVNTRRAFEPQWTKKIFDFFFKGEDNVFWKWT